MPITLIRARDALEECFWLPRGANETRTLKTFESGFNRIIALAQRKLLARPDAPMSLTINAFVGWYVVEDLMI